MPSGKPLLTARKRTHADLKRAVMTAVNRLPGCFVFPTGVGSFVSVYKGRKRFIRLGMTGTSDLVGWRTRTVNCRMCVSAASGSRCTCPGAEAARFVALEIKVGKDTVSAEQAAFLEKVSQAGGIALVVRDVEYAVKALQ